MPKGEENWKKKNENDQECLGYPLLFLPTPKMRRRRRKKKKRM